jgi:hypothetical protein
MRLILKRMKGNIVGGCVLYLSGLGWRSEAGTSENGNESSDSVKG